VLVVVVLILNYLTAAEVVI